MAHPLKRNRRHIAPPYNLSLGDHYNLNPAAVQVAEKVAAMARERGMTSAQLALLWAKEQPGVTSPIFGPRTLAHLAEGLPVLERRLDDADRPLFDALVHPGNAVADFHSTNEWMRARIP